MTRGHYCWGILLTAATLACSSSSSTTTSSGTGTATTTSGSTSGGSTSGTTSTGGSTSGTTTGGTTDAGCGCDAGYCDPQGSARCLQCLNDSQCTAPKGVCQTVSGDFNYGNCVECSTAEPTCPAGLVCDLNVGHTYQQCVADCRLDAGIPPCPFVLGEPQHCVQATGTCGPGCALNVDCGGDGGFCLVDAGLCVPCLTANDCPYSKPGCNAGQNQCGSCLTTADCPTGLTCVELYAGPPPQSSCVCLDSSQCGGNAPVCLGLDLFGDGGGGFCGCNGNADCASQGGLCTPGNGSFPACFPSCVDGGTDCSTYAAANQQFCNTTTGLCGPCVRDEQCAGYDAGTHCGPNGTCGCVTNIDCPTGTVCPLYGGQCTPSCKLDGGTDCAAQSEVCDTTTGLCVICLSDTDCAANTSAPLCSSDIDAGNSCVQCFTPDQCPASTPGCAAGTYFCGFCGQASDCPSSAPLCYQGQCVASCVLSDGGTDCDSGVCQVSTGYCVGCLSDSDCPTGLPFCGTDVDAGNSCVQCLGASDCPVDMPGCSSQAHYCGFCSTSSDCPSSAAYCQYGTCGASCVQSDGGVSCPYGVCDTSSGLCVGCLTDADCAGLGNFAAYCTADIDAGNMCAQCVQASQCTPWPCNTQYFFCGSCGSDSDCPAEAPHCSSPPNGNCTDGG